MSRYDRSLGQEAPRGRENLRDDGALKRRLLMLERTLDGIAERTLSERADFVATPRLYQDAHQSLIAAIGAALEVSRLVLGARGVQAPAGDAEVLAELGRRDISSTELGERAARAIDLRAGLAGRPIGELSEEERGRLYEALVELGDLKAWVADLRRAL